MNVSFTLHTELTASVPEFTISCLTHGGPALSAIWTVVPVHIDTVRIQEDSDNETSHNETSQVILDTLHNSVYDNRLRVRGRRTETYSCIITGISSSATSFKTITGNNQVRESKIIPSLLQLQESPPD